MGLRTLLLQVHLAIGFSLTPPSSVFISSFNMNHTLNFLPGPGNPSKTYFAVQIINYRRRLWKPVMTCLQLTAGQMCSLNREFTDPYVAYKARVQAFTRTQTSNWTISAWFQPLSDTVLGPPAVSVSGCGSCLVLHLKLPPVEQLRSIYREVVLHVQRSRDGAQFRLNLPVSEESVIPYLQPGVEYCVSVSVTTVFNINSVPSSLHCAFTSTAPSNTSLYLLCSLLCAFCLVGLLITGLFFHGGQQRMTIPRKNHLSISLFFWQSRTMEAPAQRL